MLDAALSLQDITLLSHKLTFGGFLLLGATVYLVFVLFPLERIARAEQKRHASHGPLAPFLTAEAQLQRRGSF